MKINDERTHFEELSQIKTGISQKVQKNTERCSAEWYSKIKNENAQKIYKDDELFTMAMPCCGIASGHLLVRGDGTLARFFSAIGNKDSDITTHWTAAPNFKRRGQYPYGYRTTRAEANIKQGFVVTSRQGDLRPLQLTLDQDGFSDISFVGEYPVATINYGGARESLFPLDIKAEVYSPFVPHDLRKSANPCTIYKFTVTNTSDTYIEANIGGYLENASSKNIDPYTNAVRVNKTFKNEKVAGVFMNVEEKDIMPNAPKLDKTADNYGNMSISVIADKGYSAAVIEDQKGEINTSEYSLIRFVDYNISTNDKLGKDEYSCHLMDQSKGYVNAHFGLNPGETQTAHFIISWYFENFNNDWPNKPKTNVGRMYSNWYSNSLDVANYIAENLEVFEKETFDFKNAYYDSTLPYWLNQQFIRSSSIMASHPVEWWKDGSFHSMEGVVFCFGSPNHVWHYAQAPAYLFPELEQNIRVRRDINTAMKENGRMNFREFNDTVSEDCTLREALQQWNYCADGQCGTILRFYRESLMTSDNSFLEKTWDSIQKMIGYMIYQDGLDGKIDGVIEVPQHNTSDSFLVGANTFTGSLYHASLLACEKMAIKMGDVELAQKYREIYESGREYTVKNLWNGEYFINRCEAFRREDWNTITYGNGCHIDQLNGQTWAFALGLGYLYPREMVKTALQSIFKYNFIKDQSLICDTLGKLDVMGSQANVDDAGVIALSYPKEDFPEDPKPNYTYGEFTWTGFEYHLACAMFREGLVNEGLAIYRAIYERYDPRYHNPYNEIEGGDHYTRSMAAYGGLLAISGFEYVGDENKIVFSPKINKENFKCFFSTANSYGSFAQKQTSVNQKVSLETVNGETTIKTIFIDLEKYKTPKSVTAIFDNKAVDLSYSLDNTTLKIDFSKPEKSSSMIKIEIKY